MKTLYLIACGAPQSERLYELVPLLQAAGWLVCVILTPQATKFFDRDKLTELTGYPVRSEYKQPGEASLPPADAVLVFPGTFNTINKWALGISDTLALGLLCELTGMKLPVLAVPVVRKGKLAEHPAFPRSLRMLRRYGVHILYDPDTYPPRNELPMPVIVEKLGEIVPG